MVFARFFERKSETLAILQAFKVAVEKHFSWSIGAVSTPFVIKGWRSDGSAENLAGVVADWCADHGMVHEISAPYSQLQNGLTERFIKTI